MSLITISSAGLYYGYTFRWWEDYIKKGAGDSRMRKYLERDWNINGYSGKCFRPNIECDKYIIGIECFDTETMETFSLESLSVVVEETKEELAKIIEELFPFSDYIEEPSFMIIKKEINLNDEEEVK